MALIDITYDNKQAINENTDIPAVNKVTDDDMNEIKTAVNSNNTTLTDEVLIRNNYMCVRLNSNSAQVSNSNVKFNQIFAYNGTKLTYDQTNFRIMIGAGVSKIAVSCNFMIHYSATANNTYGYEITKNGTSIGGGRLYKSQADPLSCSTPNVITEVEEDDFIALQFVSTGTGNQTIQSGTFLTVEVLE